MYDLAGNSCYLSERISDISRPITPRLQSMHFLCRHNKTVWVRNPLGHDWALATTLKVHIPCLFHYIQLLAEVEQMFALGIIGFGPKMKSHNSDWGATMTIHVIIENEWHLS